MLPFVKIAIFLVMALPVVGLVYAWRVEKSVGAAPVMTSIGMLVLLVLSAFFTQSHQVLMFLAGGIVVLYLLAPLGIVVSERGSLKRMMEEDIEKYQRAIEFDPKNAAAHAYLGDIYLKQRRYDEAIAEFETAVQLMPGHSDKERYKLRQAIEAQAREQVRLIRCEHCRKEVPAASRVCPACGENPRENFLMWLSRPDNMKEVFKTSAICMAVITLLVPLGMMLPPPILGSLIISTLIVGWVILYRSY